MKTALLIPLLIILTLSLPLPTTQVALPGSPAETFSAPISKPVATAITSDALANWFIVDENSSWTSEEKQIVAGVLHNTFAALAANGIDGATLLEGYRFRHDAGRYVDDAEARVAKIDHNVQEITLSDTAFTYQNGFTIYHELGHAVDHRLARQLSAGFHRQTGGGMVATEDGQQWETAYNYWLRLEGRDDREEAAADAFAVLVMVTHAGLNEPIFPHEPVTTDYAGISVAAAVALQG